MNAQQLKNSILQEAIMGKLVPQDPNDEPASVLLDKIREEKKQLVKEGKLKKKDLVETPINEDEIPFEIPESWEWCRLGDIGIFERGSGIKRDETSDYGYPCVRYGEMYTKYKYKPTFDKTVSFTYKSVFDKCRKAHKGDLFMALTGENKQDISLAAQYTGEEEIAVGGDLCHFTILYAFALYFVYLINSKFFSSKKELLATGDIIVHISTDKLASIAIPLPPLAEQKRIVAKIEELMPKVEAYGKAQEALDKLNEELPEKLKKSVLQEAITGKLVPQDANDEPASVLLDKIRKEKARLVKEGKLKKKDLEETPISEDEKPFEIPDSWVWCHHNELFDISGGSQPPKSDFSIEEKEGYIRLFQIRDYGENPSPVFIPLSKASKITQKGDILLARYGGSLGKVFIAEDGAYNVAMAKVEYLFNKSLIDHDYLYYYYNCSLYQDLVKGNNRSAQGGFNKEDLGSLLFPLPPFAEQKRIVAKIEELFHEIDKLKI